jgi:hypothetical protein
MVRKVHGEISTSQTCERVFLWFWGDRRGGVVADLEVLADGVDRPPPEVAVAQVWARGVVVDEPGAKGGLECGIIGARWFVDEVQSGSSLDRNAFQEMTQAADLFNLGGLPPSVEGLLVLEFARFERDEVAAPVFIGHFRLRGYTVVPTQDHGNLPTGGLETIFESLQHYKNVGPSGM